MSLTTSQIEHPKDDSKQALQQKGLQDLNQQTAQKSIQQSIEQLNQTIKQLKDTISSEGS